jgi:WD40 repeat protein
VAEGKDIPKAQVYEVPQGQELRQFGIASNLMDPFCQISALAHSPDGSTLACVQPNLGLSFLYINPGNGKRTRYRWEDSDKATFVAYSPDGKTLVVDWWDGEISLRDPETCREQARCVAQQGAVKPVSFSPDGQSLTAVFSDGSALVWDFQGAQSR